MSFYQQVPRVFFFEINMCLLGQLQDMSL